MAPTRPSSPCPEDHNDSSPSKTTPKRASGHGDPTDGTGASTGSSRQDVTAAYSSQPSAVAPPSTSDPPSSASGADNGCSPPATMKTATTGPPNDGADTSTRSSSQEVLPASLPQPVAGRFKLLKLIFALSIHRMCRMPYIWSLSHSWAHLSCFISATGRISDSLKDLSNRLSEGVFATRFCSYILGRLGYDRRQFVRVAECMDLVSTFCKHAGLAFKAVTDLLNKVSEYLGTSCAPPDHPQVNVPSAHESNEATPHETVETFGVCTSSHGGQPGHHLKVVNSISEAKDLIAQWKCGSPQCAIDVPPNMPMKTAMSLKDHFKAEGFGHLFHGARIKSRPEKGLASEDLEREDGTKRVKELQQMARPSSSSGGNTEQ